VPRTPELASTVQQLRQDLESRYPGFSIDFPAMNVSLSLPPLSAVSRVLVKSSFDRLPHAWLPQVTRSFSSEGDLENYITTTSYNDPESTKVCLLQCWVGLLFHPPHPALASHHHL